VVYGLRKHLREIRINVRLIAGIQYIHKAARIVDEAAAVGKIAHKLDPRPACRRYILICSKLPARVRKAQHIFDLDCQPPLFDRSRDRISRVLRGSNQRCSNQGRNRTKGKNSHESVYTFSAPDSKQRTDSLRAALFAGLADRVDAA